MAQFLLDGAKFIFVMVPMALVRPSRNIILLPIFRYSGFLMKANLTLKFKLKNFLAS